MLICCPPLGESETVQIELQDLVEGPVREDLFIALWHAHQMN